jgi:hypothetical protein
VSRFFPLLGFLLFVTVGLACPHSGWAAAEPPRILVEAPPALAATAREIERLAPESIAAAAALVGGDTGALLGELQPITIVLVPEGRCGSGDGAVDRGLCARRAYWARSSLSGAGRSLS